MKQFAIVLVLTAAAVFAAVEVCSDPPRYPVVILIFVLKKSSTVCCVLSVMGWSKVKECSYDSWDLSPLIRTSGLIDFSLLCFHVTFRFLRRCPIMLGGIQRPTGNTRIGLNPEAGQMYYV